MSTNKGGKEVDAEKFKARNFFTKIIITIETKKEGKDKVRIQKRI